MQVKCASCYTMPSSCLLGHNGVNLGLHVLALFQSLLPLDDLRNAFDEHVAQLDLGLAQAVRVGDVPGAAGGSGVDASGTCICLSLFCCSDQNFHCFLLKI